MFTHLHVHTEYSLLDGLSRIGPLLRRAKDLRMDSLGITDHGNMYGAIDFYLAARKEGINPIIGCEMYVAPGSRFDKGLDGRRPYHITVLAKDAKGYQNLVKLVTRAHLEGFYYKPRVDRDLLQQYHEGLIALSGCPGGEVPTLINQGRMKEATEAASWYKELFGDYYLELMEHGGIPELPAINKGLLQLWRELNIPVVATNDVHYVSKGEAHLQDILICIHTNTNIHDEKRLRMWEDSYYLRSHEEMQALYPELPEALASTERIAEMCDIRLDFSQLRLPEFKVPNGMTADAYLEQLCWDGLRSRVEHVSSGEKERLAYELEVIKQTRFANYFLVVWDIAQFVRRNDIFFAVRGSAAASLTLYCLGATDINPLPYKLVFERFLNVERKEMPDIDMDFQDDRREEVINYVVSKYGRDHVAQIITFGTLGARASIRDVGRALGMPYSDVDIVARLVPFKLNITLDEAIEQTPPLREIYDEDENTKTLVDTARGLEGTTRHSSTHAAGVVISKDPLDDVVPLQRPVKGDDASVFMTQYAMAPLAALGLLKMDLLGLANLTILSKARKLILETHAIQLSPRDIPLDDVKTFDLMARGETAGVFQLEGTGMSRYIKELKPTSIKDVAAMIALYRPGPMEHITTFIDAKHGRKEPLYPHPALRDILEETYGVIVYQDQVLHIVRTFAGYSLGEADTVRKAMGKKIPEIMAQEQKKFLAGALEQGYTEELAREVFMLIEPFAGYAFNKAHSVSYGLISYWTAYLKAHYPIEYMVSLLNSYLGNSEKIAAAIAECRRLRIPIMSPSINRGGVEFLIENADDGRCTIRFGMSAIKNVGGTAVHAVLKARANADSFSSIEHMCRVADMSGMNRRTLESLIKAGALDDFGDRGAVLSVVDRILALAQSEASLRDSNQTSMFDLFGETVPTPLATVVLPEIHTSQRQVWEWEKEHLGVTLSNVNLLTSFGSEDSETIMFRSDITAEMAAHRQVMLRGQVSSVTQRFTRDQRPFTIATVSLMDGTVDVFVWEELQKKTDGLWEEGKLVLVGGKVRVRDDQISISCIKASEYVVPELTDASADGDERVTVLKSARPSVGGWPVEAAALQPGSPPKTVVSSADKQATKHANMPRRLNLRLQETDQPANDRSLLDDVKRLLLEHNGDDEIGLEIATEGRVITLEWPLVRVDASPELEHLLRELLGGAGHVSVESLQT